MEIDKALSRLPLAISISAPHAAAGCVRRRNKRLLVGDSISSMGYSKMALNTWKDYTRNYAAQSQKYSRYADKRFSKFLI